MKPFRSSIAGMMIVVLIVAIDFAAFRFVPRALSTWSIKLHEPIITGTLPMSSILAAGLWYGFQKRMRRKKVRLSVMRFELWGWTALAVWTGCFALFTEPIHTAAGGVARLLISPHSLLTEALFLCIVIGLLLLPPLTTALVASGLPARYRIRIVIEPLGASALDRDARTTTASEFSGDGPGWLDGH